MNKIEQIWHSIRCANGVSDDVAERGDTLIEVAIAMAVLGAVALLTFTTMNSSLLSIMDSTQRTSVQQKVNSQIEMINYIRSNDPDQWKAFTDAASDAGYAPLKDDSYKCRMNKYHGAPMPSIYTDSTDFYSNFGSVWLEYHPDDTAHPVRVYNLATANGTNDFNRSTAAKYWGGRVSNKDYAFDGRSGMSTVSITDPQPGYGIWVDVGAAQPRYATHVAVRADEPYIDVVVKACWTPFGAKSDGEARISQTYRIHKNEASEDY